MTLRALLLATALAGAALSSASAQAPAAYDRPASYDGVAKSSQYIRSFDGTRLAVDVYRPTRGGTVSSEKLPVIVTQMRSADAAQRTRMLRYFTDHGYVWVAQDRRGTGASFGRQKGFVNDDDTKDAKAVIDWAAAQPFSSGKTVTVGCSNQGEWQYRVAALAPKSLVAIAPACASPQFFDDAVTRNGVPIFDAPHQIFDFNCANGPRPPRQAEKAEPVDADKDGALLKQAEAEHACNAPMLGQYWLNMPRDGLNTVQGYRPGIEDSPVTRAADIKRSGVAVLSLGGWYDAALVGQFASQAYWGGRVIVGPWMHGNGPIPGSDFPAQKLDLNAETLRWFDHYAKGAANGAERPGVLYYTVNAPAGREWRQAPTWPWGAARTTYYFGQDALTRARPAGRTPPLDYHKPEARWLDGRYQSLRHWSPDDMAKTDADSLSQTSTPLPADMEVTGTPTARLWVSADTADANVFALVEDVGPDGRSTYVTDGFLRASWRKLAPSPWGVAQHHWHRGYQADLAPLAPGRPAELVFDLYPTSYVFKAGHRVRVSLATSIGQGYQAPPDAKGEVPAIRLYRGGAQASAVELPVANR